MIGGGGNKEAESVLGSKCSKSVQKQVSLKQGWVKTGVEDDRWSTGKAVTAVCLDFYLASEYVIALRVGAAEPFAEARILFFLGPCPKDLSYKMNPFLSIECYFPEAEVGFLWIGIWKLPCHMHPPVKLFSTERSIGSVMNKCSFSCEFPSRCGLHLVYTLPFLILVCGFHKGEIRVLLTLQCHVPYSQINLILAGGKKRSLFKQKKNILFNILSVFKEDINECCFILIKNMQMA